MNSRSISITSAISCLYMCRTSSSVSLPTVSSQSTNSQLISQKRVLSTLRNEPVAGASVRNSICVGYLFGSCFLLAEYQLS